MPQGTIILAFSMNETMYIVLGAIPCSQKALDVGYTDSEPSLLAVDSAFGIPRTKFYMDDIFTGGRSFQEAYEFLEQHLLPRLLWS